MTYSTMPGRNVYDGMIGNYQQGPELPPPPNGPALTDSMIAAGDMVLDRWGAEGLTGFTVAEIYKAMLWEHHLQGLRAKGEKVSCDMIHDAGSGG